MLAGFWSASCAAAGSDEGEGTLASAVDRLHEGRPRQLAADELAGAERSLEHILWASIDAFTAALFGSTSFAADRPNVLNRHGVLHGRDEPQWTQADCLRLFQALHTLGSARLLKKRDMRELFCDPGLYDALNALPVRNGPE